MDRRIKKTHILLKKTLTELIEEKELRKITVSELCERANINRGTFYLHFLDIYDMIEQFQKAIISDLVAIIEKIILFQRIIIFFPSCFKSLNIFTKTCAL